MKNLKVFLIALALFYSIFLLQYLKVFGVNFFSIPKNEEIFLLSFNNRNFTIFSNSYQVCKINNRSVLLEYGVNNFSSQPYVFINCNNKTLWFKLNNATAGGRIELQNYSITFRDSKLLISLKGKSNLSGLYRIPLIINNKGEEILYYFTPGNFSIYKEIKQTDENVNITIEFFGKQLKKNIITINTYSFAFLFSFLAIVVLSVCFLEVNEAFLIVTFFVIFYFHFCLSLPQSIQWVMLFGIIIIALLVYVKNIKNGKKGKKKGIKFEKSALLLAFVFVIFVFLIKATIGYSSVWGYYYSRMAEETYLHSSPFFFDNLSYLGREFIYPYGYFDFSAGIAKILNVDYLSIEPFLHAVILFLFCYTTLLIFKKLNKHFVGAFLFLSQTFIFITSVISPLHVFSLLFLNLSILFALSNKKIFSAISLAISFVSHSLSIFFFPFFILPFFKKEKIKDYAEIIFLAVVLSLPFYVNFLRFKPMEVAPFSLGLLQPTQGILSENLFLVPLLVISFTLAILRNSFKRENLLAVVVFLANILIYRVNIAAVFLISYAVSKTLSKDYKLLYIFSVLNFFFASLIYSGTNIPCEWGAATQTCIAPMLYVSKFSYSNVSVPGYFGHLETFFGKQPVVSDYYVEYAKPENFYAQENFCKTGNFSYLQSFKVELIVTSKYYCADIKNFSNFQKIYTNGYFDVYLPRK